MISGFTPHALDQLADALGGGGSSATVVIDLASLTAQVSKVRAAAERIATAVENPTWAAGDELCRRAAIALEKGWFDEAAADAQASIDAYPYRAAPHLLAGVAHLHLADPLAALEYLSSSVRYGAAAEAGHAATAGLLAAGLAYAARASDTAAQILTDTDESTEHRCPAVLAARAVNGVHDPNQALRVLLDDPAAWLTVEVSPGFFGPAVEPVLAAQQHLVETVSAAAAAAARFDHTSAAIPADRMHFYNQMFDSGKSRYSGPYDGRAIWRGGAALAAVGPYVDSIAALPDDDVAGRVTAGIQLLRYLGWRIPSREEVDPATWSDLRFERTSVATSEEEDQTGTYAIRDDETATDVTITAWDRTLDDNVRFEDRPRSAGKSRGTGVYLRALRAWHAYQGDREFVEFRCEMARRDAAARPTIGIGRRAKFAISQANRAERELSDYEAWLACPPPDVSALVTAVGEWFRISRGPGEGSVRPFAGVNLPTERPTTW
jgi:hypothetical protein